MSVRVFNLVFRGRLVRFQGPSAVMWNVERLGKESPAELVGVVQELAQKNGCIPEVINVT